MTDDRRKTTDVWLDHGREGIAKSDAVSYLGAVQDYRRLFMWQRARSVNKRIYRLTGTFPREERFGLTQQMRRAAISITSNIAEGCGRDTENDLARFLSFASGSAHELESQVFAAMDLGFVDERSNVALMDEIAEVKAMLFAYRRTIRATG